MEENTQNVSAKEAYEERKHAREKRRAKRQQKGSRGRSAKKVQKIILWLAVLALVVVGIVFASRVGSPNSEDQSVRFSDQGREHIAVGSEHPEYNSNPPTSGWHYPGPAVPGFYEEPLPDEQVVHNLEHGEVWIAYKSDLDSSVIEQLREFAGPKTIITPRDANETDVALVAWTRLDAFDLDEVLNVERINDFIKRYQNRGPERVPSSAHYNR